MLLIFFCAKRYLPPPHSIATSYHHNEFITAARCALLAFVARALEKEETRWWKKVGENRKGNKKSFSSHLFLISFQHSENDCDWNIFLYIFCDSLLFITFLWFDLIGKKARNNKSSKCARAQFRFVSSLNARRGWSDVCVWVEYIWIIFLLFFQHST